MIKQTAGKEERRAVFQACTNPLETWSSIHEAVEVKVAYECVSGASVFHNLHVLGSAPVQHVWYQMKWDRPQSLIFTSTE
ncbi:hypothetical protein TNCT_42101 [Trichonephila clavata]|uniref:Uncharacterized protein n=1 Tax=Trichonephila clavata TaxID=2740835 RepID=A0A8X6FMI4_TRICU|nr:hypothetical protein TNCT_42101 [Trichonephila clavata]